MTQPASVGATRLARLDLLRALAAIEVMAYHVSRFHPGGLGLLDGVLANGDLGVVVFFVLSGYLLARPFVTGEVRTRAYLIRRAARIVPAYLAALVGLTLLTGDDSFPRHALEYLTFTQNYDAALVARGVHGVTWTLQLEVQFYLLLPLLMGLVLMVGRLLPRTTLCLLVLLGLVSVVAHMSAIASPDPWTTRAGRVTLPAMLWAFVPGVALAWCLGRWPRLATPLAHPIVAVLALVVFAYGWLLPTTTLLAVGEQCIALACGTALLLPWLAYAPEATHGVRRRGEAALAWFGRTVSYPFYLWHYPLVFIAIVLGLSSWGTFLAVFGAATLVGLISWRYVERPAMRAAERWIGRMTRDVGLIRDPQALDRATAGPAAAIAGPGTS